MTASPATAKCCTARWQKATARTPLHRPGGATELKGCARALAIGRSGNFRKLGVPARIWTRSITACTIPRNTTPAKGQLVVGGGDSALETAIALCQGGADVTLSYRKPEFSRPKPDNVSASLP